MTRLVHELHYATDFSGHKRRAERLTCAAEANMELRAGSESLSAPLLHTAASRSVLASLKVGGVGLRTFSVLVTV